MAFGQGQVRHCVNGLWAEPLGQHWMTVDKSDTKSVTKHLIVCAKVGY